MKSYHDFCIWRIWVFSPFVRLHRIRCIQEKVMSPVTVGGAERRMWRNEANGVGMSEWLADGEDGLGHGDVATGLMILLQLPSTGGPNYGYYWEEGEDDGYDEDGDDVGADGDERHDEETGDP